MRVTLTAKQASLVLSNWGYEHFAGVGWGCQNVWLCDILPAKKAREIIAAWGGSGSTTSNRLASIIQVDR